MAVPSAMGGCLRYIALLAFAATLTRGVSADPAASATLDKPPAVELTRSEGGCQARLWLQPERGILHLGLSSTSQTTAVTFPVTKSALLWHSLLEQAFREHGRRSEYLLTVGPYPELGSRMAEAAARSGRWDLKTGRPLSGEAADAVRSLLNQKAMFREIEELFAPFHYSVFVHSVEDVMLGRWMDSKPPLAAASAETAAISPNALVPCGASVVFKLTSNQPEH